MPQQQYPYPLDTPIVIEVEDPILAETLAKIANEHTKGFSLDVRIKGWTRGYLFHFVNEDSRYVILTYANERVASLASIDELTRFVNHCSGLAFDQGMWQLGEDINRRFEFESQGKELLGD